MATPTTRKRSGKGASRRSNRPPSTAPPPSPAPTKLGGNGNGTAAAITDFLSAKTSLLRAASSVIVERAQFAAKHGLSFRTTDTKTTGFNRDLYYTLGYPDDTELTVDMYRSEYRRGGISKRIVEAPARATWAGGASIVEDPDPGVETPFEAAALELFDRLDIWSRLLRADILAGIGRYSVLLIGARTEGEGATLADPLESVRSPDDIIWLSPLAEDKAPILSLVEDLSDPRYGLPEFYSLNLGGTHTSEKTHWSRVIHIAEGCLEDDVYGTPRLRPVWNLLVDLHKITGGGGEATWRRMAPGMNVDIDPMIEMSQAEEDALADNVEEYRHNLDPVIRTRGAKISLLSSTVPAFGPNAAAIIDQIAGTTAMPKRMLMGSERGELSSTQDRNNWADRVQERTQEFAEPLAAMVVRRLADLGALTLPEVWSVAWPESDELDEREKAEVAGELAGANQKQFAVTGEIIITSDEIRRNILRLDSSLEEVEPGAAVNGGEVVGIQAARLRLRSAKRRLTLRAGETFEDVDTPPPDEPEWAAVHRAGDRNRGRVMSVLLASWVGVGTAVDTQALVSALEQGSPDRAVELLALDQHTAALTESMAGALLTTLDAGGLATLRSVRARGSWLKPGEEFHSGDLEALRTLRGPDFDYRAALLQISFDVKDPASIDWANLHSARLITEVSDRTREGVRALIVRGLEEGIAPRPLARQIMQSVGLRSDQVATLYRFREQGATAKQLAARARKMRRQRATLIARTETLRAANEGQRQLWIQSRDRGDLPSTVKRVWIATGDDRTRDEHAAMDGQVRGLEESFISPLGRALEPGEDPNCRCAQGIASKRDVERNVFANPETRSLMERADAGEITLGDRDLWDALSPAERAKIERYYARASANDPEYRALIDATAKQFRMTAGDFDNPTPGTYFYGPLKETNRIAEKALTETGQRLDQVNDVLRMTYVIDDPEDAIRIYQELVRTDAPQGLKNRLLRPATGGYRDVIFKVRLEDGMMAEVQINFREILLVKNGRGHEIYEAMRAPGMVKGSPEWQALADESERLYTEAWISVCRRFPGFAGCSGLV